MNKKTTILGIIIIVIVCILTTGCFYDAVDSKEFESHFKDLGFTISDNKTPKYETDKYLVASKDDVPFNIEYYEFKDEKEASKVYKKYKESISDYITTKSKNNEQYNSVMSKTVAVSTDEYIVISRVRNTLIFVNGKKANQKQIDEYLEKIEY